MFESIRQGQSKRFIWVLVAWRSDLEGIEVPMPDQFEGDYCIVAVAFAFVAPVSYRAFIFSSAAVKHPGDNLHAQWHNGGRHERHLCSREAEHRQVVG